MKPRNKTEEKVLNDMLDLIDFQTILIQNYRPNVKESNRKAYVALRNQIFATLAKMPAKTQLTLLVECPFRFVCSNYQDMNFTFIMAAYDRTGTQQLINLLTNILNANNNFADDIIKHLNTVRDQNDYSFSTEFSANQESQFLAYLALLENLKKKTENGESKIKDLLRGGRHMNFMEASIRYCKKGESILAAIQSNLVPASEWAVIPEAKRKLADHILNLEPTEQKKLLHEALENNTSPLFDFFHTQREMTKPSVKKGILGELSRKLDKLEGRQTVSLTDKIGLMFRSSSQQVSTSTAQGWQNNGADKGKEKDQEEAARFEL